MEKYTIEQLKALAYDYLAQIERFQQALREVNSEIAKKQSEPKEEKETKKK